MSDTRDEEYDLSEGQRLALLEHTVNTNRNMLVVMVLLALVAISVAITVVVIKFVQPDVVYAEQKEFNIALQRLDGIEQRLQESRLAAIDTQKILNSSGATAFKEQLLAQEQSYQLHLEALKQGMSELAHMVPGSRTWLDIYSEKMDIAIQQSQQRQLQLEKLQTSRLHR